MLLKTLSLLPEITYSVQEISVWLFLEVNIVFITFRKQQEFT